MHTLFIYCHPEPKSFNASLVRAGAKVLEERRDVVAEIDKLMRADLVVFQFPIWRHSAPAMLKGWMDRVFVSGGLYTSKMRYDQGKFRGKRAICSVTTGAPAVSFEPGGRGGEISQILWPSQYSLYYLGFDVLTLPCHLRYSGAWLCLC